MDSYSLSAFSAFFLLFFLLSFSFIFSLLEAAFMSASEERIYKLKVDGLRKAAVAHDLLENKESVVAICSLTDHLLNISASSVMTIFLMKYQIVNSNHIILFGASFVMSIFIFIVTESIPQVLGIRRADGIILDAASFMQLFIKIIRPLLFVIEKINSIMISVFDVQKDPKTSSEANQSILGAVEMYYRKGAIIHEHREMLNSVLNLDKYDISHVMTHKSDTYALSLADTADELYEKIVGSQYSKIPVFDEKYDQVVGILKVIDFLKGVQNGSIKKLEADDSYNLEPIMQKPCFIPEGASLKSQLPKFKENGSNMGIVIDEYGNVLGIVTTEDVVEHIVGDIKDENDSDIMFKVLAENTFMVDGDLPIIEFNEKVDSDFIDSQFSTVSGLITNHLERIPNQGEEFRISNCSFKVIQITNNRIEKVKVVLDSQQNNETSI